RSKAIYTFTQILQTQTSIFRTSTQVSSCSSFFINTPLLCFRRKQLHSMKECFAATCGTSRCHTTRAFHDLHCQLFRSYSAVKTLDTFIEATNPAHPPLA
ncbi:hypothetical protein CF327_g7831, partial [Tilletia walkeri]